MKNGITYPTSRYLTFIADNQKPMPEANKVVNNAINGKKMIVAGGTILKQSNRKINTMPEIRQSINPVIAAAKGIMIFGK